MPININPNRINVPSGAPGKAMERKRRRNDSDEFSVVPTRADVNHIPGVETLRTLIAGAVEALRNGITWDRGTILNLLV